ncbi:hypothetical protein [Streptomyces californicus]|uniref:hypothetical protein n=1 Tax=Streptomyces californicus TaxID=67351 RepID=UPI0033EDEBA6
MRKRTALIVAVTLLTAVGCGSPDGGGASESDSPPPGASEAVERYVDALNDRDLPALLKIGAAPDEPWSREQADELIRSKGGKGLTITKAPITYDRMGDYMGTAALTASDKEGRPVRESIELLHEQKRWHVVLFEPPSGNKPSSAP